jgi:hypothetical protein
MISHDKHVVRVVVFAVATAAASACAPPDTDIVDTNTERVGDYSVVAERDGDALHANICVGDPPRADAVAHRVLHQLMSRGYHTITLDMYAPPQRPVRRVVWTPEARRDAPLTAAPPQHFCQTTSQRSPDAAEP